MLGEGYCTTMVLPVWMGEHFYITKEGLGR